MPILQLKRKLELREVTCSKTCNRCFNLCLSDFKADTVFTSQCGEKKTVGAWDVSRAAAWIDGDGQRGRSMAGISINKGWTQRELQVNLRGLALGHHWMCRWVLDGNE